MKNLRIFSIFIATILLGASVAVYAGEIDAGSIDVVINDDVYGSVSPTLNLENTTITLKAYEIVQGGESTYQVQDNITIPLSVVVNKEKVYGNKMITGRIKLYASLADVRAKAWFNAYVADGELFGKDVNISENVSIPVKYGISEETFMNGEQLVMCTFVIGRYLPGKVDESSLLWSLDNALSDSFLFGLGKIIKEFVDIESIIDMNLQILTIEHIKLNVTYEYGGQQVQPDEYILNATVAEGNGLIQKNPNLGSYPAGTNVTLTAVANYGYYFDHWDGDVTGSENPVNITMDSNKSVQAYFLQTPLSTTPKSLGIRVASFIVKNQEETNVSFAWNITLQGGILGLVNVFSNGTVDDLGSNASVTISSGRTKLFALGPGRAIINIDRPGEELITEEFGVTFIGPIVLVG
jgi:hypothetical protein